MTQPIKLDNLRDLVAMGAVKSATILGQKGGYAVLASTGIHERLLANKAGDVRMFATTDTAVNELRRLGLSHFSLDITHYEKGSLRPPRPDVTRKAKEASEALAHDQWFRAQVDEALNDEASGQAIWHAHDDVWAMLEAETVQLVAERDAKKAAKPAKRVSSRAGRG